MRYNKEDLVLLASQPSHKYEKEGLLIIREKTDGFFRRSEGKRKSETKTPKNKRESFSCVGPNEQVITERWFRLSGNLLFYLKSRDHWSEPFGVIILENYSVRVDPKSSNSPGGYQFIIDFSSGGFHLLAAYSEAERASWIEAINEAGFSAMRKRIQSLKLQIQSRLFGVEQAHEVTVNSVFPPVNASGYIKDLSESPLAEISLACDNLKCDSHGRPPSAKVVIHVRNHPGSWVKYTSTELVEKNSNPVFLTTVNFRRSDGLDDNSDIQFTVYHVRERVTQTQTMIGLVVAKLGSLLEIDRIRVPILSSLSNCYLAAGTHEGFLTMTVWNLEREAQLSTESTPCRTAANLQLNRYDTNSLPYSHRRTQSLPSRLGQKLKIPRQNNFGVIFSNPFMQTYRFHSGLGGDIFMHEIMAESKLSFTFPQQLLSLWIAEEKELLQEIIGLGELREPWHSRQVQLLEKHLCLINIYTQARQNLLRCKGNDFKLSSSKTDPAYEFAPVNLHFQTMWICNESLHKSGFHDMVTTGAFTAIPQGFQHGGLTNLLNDYKDFPCDDKESLRNSHFQINKVKMVYDSVQGIKRLRKEVIERMQIIMKLAKERKTQGLHRFVEDIFHRCRLLLTICDQTLIEETFEFMECQKLSLPTSTSLDFDSVRSNTFYPDEPSRFIDEGVDTPNSPLRSVVEIFKTKERSSTEDRTPDSGLGLDEVVKLFLDSPSSNYYRPSEEPEPWDLTQLNIEASVISLNSKIKILSGQGANISFSALRPLLPIQRAQSVKTHLNLPKISNEQWRKSLREESNAQLQKVKASEPKLSLTLTLPNSQSPPHNDHQVLSIHPLQNTNSGMRSSDWCDELRSSLKKLRLAMDGLLKTSRLAHAVFRLQEHPEKSRLGFLTKHRRDVCFSQALTALLTGLMGRLWCRKADPVFLYVMLRLGPLVSIQSFLTCYSREAPMFSDMLVAVQDLRAVEFVIVRHNVGSYAYGVGEEEQEVYSDSSKPFPCPKVYGTRSNLKVVLPVPDSVFSMLPVGPSHSTSFVVTPVFFNMGINIKATLAEKLKILEPQQQLNRESFAKLSEYCRQYTKLQLPSKCTSKRKTVQDSSITKLLCQLENELASGKPKNVEVMHLASRISRLVKGIGIFNCKSGKDRTGMAVTLEEVQILSEEYDLAEHEFQFALDAIRSEGCRRENTLKNIGLRKYAFNSIQVLGLPKLYRPPPGTFETART